MPYNMTITSWTLLADVSTTSVVDIWKAGYASYPPLVSNSIIGATGTKPTITSAIKGQSSTLTAWTTSISSGDIVRFYVNTNTSATKLTITIQGTQV